MSLMAPVVLTGCIATGGASLSANEAAEQSKYQPVEYANQARKGPYLVVVPGQIKSTNATFHQKYGPNNIADYAELELQKANFRVLERADLGPMLQEVKLAFGMGDRNALRKFKRGKFKSTQWLVRFDVLKAEPAAAASQGFDGSVLAGLMDSRVGRTLVGSTRVDESADVWVVGLRYKVLNANTSQQVASGYFEETMESGGQSTSFLGFSQSGSQQQTLDSLVQRLVQLAVKDLDAKK